MEMAGEMPSNKLTVAIVYDIEGSESCPPGTLDHIRPDPLGGYDAAVDGIAGALRGLGHSPVAVGDFYRVVATLGANPKPGWDMVISLVGGVRGVARETQMPALLEAYDIPFAYSDSLVMAICGNKARTKVRQGIEPGFQFGITYDVVALQ
jgi:hypothetical protein